MRLVVTFLSLTHRAYSIKCMEICGGLKEPPLTWKLLLTLVMLVSARYAEIVQIFIVIVDVQS